MKKVPVILSTIGLIAGSAGALPARASDGAFILNKYAPWGFLRYVDPVSGDIGFGGILGIGNDYCFQRMIVGWYDYASGVTEDDANTAGMTLGAAADNSDTDGASGGAGGSGTTGASGTSGGTGVAKVWERGPAETAKAVGDLCGRYEGALATGANLLEVNKADMVYYAFELKNKKGETAWVRGKLSYRECAHSGEYDDVTEGASPAVCNLTVMRDANGEAYLRATVPRMLADGYVDKTPSWAEERAGLVRPLIEAVAEKVTKAEEDLKKGVKATEAEIAGWRAEIKAAELEIAKYGSTEYLKAEIEALEKRIKAVEETEVTVVPPAATEGSQGGSSQGSSQEGAQGGSQGSSQGASEGAEGGSGAQKPSEGGLGGDGPQSGSGSATGGVSEGPSGGATSGAGSGNGASAGTTGGTGTVIMGVAGSAASGVSGGSGVTATTNTTTAQQVAQVATNTVVQGALAGGSEAMNDEEDDEDEDLDIPEAPNEIYEGDLDEEEEIETPALGEEEKSFTPVILGILATAGLVGVGAWVLKRKLGKKEAEF